MPPLDLGALCVEHWLNLDLLHLLHGPALRTGPFRQPFVGIIQNLVEVIRILNYPINFVELTLGALVVSFLESVVLYLIFIFENLRLERWLSHVCRPARA